MRYIQEIIDNLSQNFNRYNKYGFISAILFGSIMLIPFFYGGALYSTFRDGFALQEMVRDSRTFASDVVQLQVAMEQARNAFTTGQVSVLDRMEKVSSIRYIESGSVAAFLTQPSSQ